MYQLLISCSRLIIVDSKHAHRFGFEDWRKRAKQFMNQEVTVRSARVIGCVDVLWDFWEYEEPMGIDKDDDDYYHLFKTFCSNRAFKVYKPFSGIRLVKRSTAASA